MGDDTAACILDSGGWGSFDSEGQVEDTLALKAQSFEKGWKSKQPAWLVYRAHEK